jgi:hypothetical protein
MLRTHLRILETIQGTTITGNPTSGRRLRPLADMSASSTPSSTATPGSSDIPRDTRPPSKRASTSSHLEQLSILIMETITTSDEIVEYLSDDFEMYHEYVD